MTGGVMTAGGLDGVRGLYDRMGEEPPIGTDGRYLFFIQSWHIICLGQARPSHMSSTKSRQELMYRMIHKEPKKERKKETKWGGRRLHRACVILILASWFHIAKKRLFVEVTSARFESSIKRAVQH